MTAAAEHLEKLSAGTVERNPMLDISRAILAPGPAVGPGVQGHGPAIGLRFDPDTCQKVSFNIFRLV